MVKRVDVFGRGAKVGTLALTDEGKVAFQYDEQWVEQGFSINPFKLPLSNRVFLSSSPYFRGLFGVFGDSLPDSYGELLLERFLKRKGVNPNALSCLDRLSYVGSSGMGLLEYVPDFGEKPNNEALDFDVIQQECNDLFDSKEVRDIETLYAMGGSSGGARPKSLIRYKGEDWIVKFSARFDPKNIAELEHKYMSLAKKFGINVPDIELFVSPKGNKYFLIKRFDRLGEKRVHTITAAGLLECDYRAPSLDYDGLLKLTWILTRDESDVIEMYRRMVFNVLIDNQDDHAKNFSFVYNDLQKGYRLSPAYDITPGKTYYGEHTTSVLGKGKNITDEDMVQVAAHNKIDDSTAKEIIQRCRRLLDK